MNTAAINRISTATELRNERKNRRIAFIGATSTFLLILLLLLFFSLSPPNPPLPEPEPLQIVLGMDATGMNNTFDPVKSGGQQTPQQEQVEPQPEPQPPTEAAPVEPDVTPTTTDIEAPAIQKPKEEVKKPKPVEEPKKKATEEPVKEEPKVNKDALFTKSDKKPGNNGASDGSNYSKGTGTKPGDQGSPTGGIDAKSWVGGDLKGRGVLALPKPEENYQVEGIVVVNVCVSPDGKVVSARAGGRGSTITNPDAVSAAEQKAKEARFQADSNAPSLQCGTITYNFQLK